MCAHGSVCVYVCKAGTGSVFCFRATSCGKDTADCLRACTPARTAQCVCAEAGARISVCVRVREREREKRVGEREKYFCMCGKPFFFYMSMYLMMSRHYMKEQRNNR